MYICRHEVKKYEIQKWDIKYTGKVRYNLKPIFYIYEKPYILPRKLPLDFDYYSGLFSDIKGRKD